MHGLVPVSPLSQRIQSSPPTHLLQLGQGRDRSEARADATSEAGQQARGDRTEDRDGQSRRGQSAEDELVHGDAERPGALGLQAAGREGLQHAAHHLQGKKAAIPTQAGHCLTPAATRFPSASKTSVGAGRLFRGTVVQPVTVATAAGWGQP